MRMPKGELISTSPGTGLRTGTVIRAWVYWLISARATLMR